MKAIIHYTKILDDIDNDSKIKSEIHRRGGAERIGKYDHADQDLLQD